VEDGEGGDGGGEEQLRGEDAVDLADEAPAEGALPERDLGVQRLPVARLQVNHRRLYLLLHLGCPAVSRRRERLHLRHRRHPSLFLSDGAREGEMWNGRMGILRLNARVALVIVPAFSYPSVSGTMFDGRGGRSTITACVDFGTTTKSIVFWIIEFELIKYLIL
jgi:hypothetical protein